MLIVACAAVVSAGFFDCSSNARVRGAGCTCCQDVDDGVHLWKYAIDKEPMVLLNISYYPPTGPVQQKVGLCIQNVPFLDENTRARVGTATGCFDYNTITTSDFSQPASVDATVFWNVNDPCSRGSIVSQSPNNRGFYISPVVPSSIYYGTWTHIGVLDLPNAVVASAGTGRLAGYRGKWRMVCFFDMSLLTPSSGNKITFDCDMQIELF